MDDGRIELRNYTRARRQPQVIGKIGGWYPIWGVASVTQYVVATVVFVVLLTTTWLWAHLGPVGNVLVFVLVPFGLAWLVRRARVDGRGPIAAIGGLVNHLAGVNGTLLAATRPTLPPTMRPVRPARGVDLGSPLEPMPMLVARARQHGEREWQAETDREHAIVNGGSA